MNGEILRLHFIRLRQLPDPHFISLRMTGTILISGRRTQSAALHRHALRRLALFIPVIQKNLRNQRDQREIILAVFIFKMPWWGSRRGRQGEARIQG